MLGDSGFMNLKFPSILVLAVFSLVILGTYTNLFANDLNNDPALAGHGWSMEYNWSTYVTEGRPLYPTWETEFIEGSTLAYMPIYFLVTGNLMKVFGESAVVGKLVSAVSVLGTAFLIYLIGVKISGRKWISSILGVLFLFYPTVANYTSVQMKIEPLGLFFSTLGLYLVVVKKYLWAVPFAVLAFFTKQYYIIVPAATCLYLLFKDKTNLVKYCVLYLALVIVGFGIGELVTRGVFFRHTVLFMFDPQFGSLEVERVTLGFLVCLGYLVPSLLIAVYGMWKTKYFGLLGIYLVVSLVVLGITIGKVGSGINYTLDSLVASCCLSALIIPKLRRENESSETSGYSLTNPSSVRGS